MPDGSRLPTSAFGFVAVVVLSIGGGWWINAAPPAPPPRAEAPATVTPARVGVVAPRGDGSRRTYMGRRGSGMRSWQHRAAATEAYAQSIWPCRTARMADAPAAPLTRGLRCARPD